MFQLKRIDKLTCRQELLRVENEFYAREIVKSELRHSKHQISGLDEAAQQLLGPAILNHQTKQQMMDRLLLQLKNYQYVLLCPWGQKPLWPVVLESKDQHGLTSIQLDDANIPPQLHRVLDRLPNRHS
ncbi:hypothetical protein [Dongshaea marina]|uniref:hypothetical protein n=1 Tax=Dongshaea marina TaxID=2047966 RepID=UPI000D3E6569|nr:hypothetical protein [Dongshaea marina]